MMQREILFLCHRIPYPPDKGDKIRSYHFLEGLSRRYRVHLGTFIDDPADWDHRGVLEAICDQTCFVGLDPRRARVHSLSGLLSGKPLTFTYYRSRRLARWVAALHAERPLHAVVAFSSSMGPYAATVGGTRRILDFVDVDSAKWRQYADDARWPASWLYRREFKRLLAAEIRLARGSDASVFVSEAEADLFRRLAPRARERVTSIANGVDTAYFDPEAQYENPYGDGGPVMVFTGAMDYRANVDAACWFADAVLPRVREQIPDARFYIVGSRPAAAVRDLATRAGVIVTGRVPDVRPYVRYATLAVAPLRIARGLQNKVLEALAMDRPVLATPQAWEGIDGMPADCAWSASGVADQAAIAIEQLRRRPDARGQARQFVSQRYDWNRALNRLVDLIEARPNPSGTPQVNGEYTRHSRAGGNPATFPDAANLFRLQCRGYREDAEEKE